MMMLRCSAPSIRVRCCSALVALSLVAVAAPDAVRTGDLSALKQGIDSLEAGRLDAARAALSPLPGRLPALADYIAFWQAQTEAQSKNWAAVPKLLEPVFRVSPESPLSGRAAVLATRAYLEQGNGRSALAALDRVNASRLPQPEASVLKARAAEIAGDPATAALAWQLVYFRYPFAADAAPARENMTRLATQLGKAYPEPTADDWLDRASSLMNGGRAAQAKQEFQGLVTRLTGLPREQARVRVGAADYTARNTAAALTYLKSFRSDQTEAEAERLYYVSLAARRLNRDSEMEEAMAQLANTAPASPWRLQALVSAGNRYLVDNLPRGYLPYFKACADQFETEERAPYCHWFVVWQSWLNHSEDAPALLRQHLLRFPQSEKAAAALYFLGREAERDQDYSAAKRFWREVVHRFPNFYYGLLSRDALQRAEVARAGENPAIDRFISSIKFPNRERTPSFQPDAKAAKRIERARLLATAGLERWAEGELRFGARNEPGSGWALAVEMAETATRRGAPDQAMRYIKATVPEYLYMPRESAPERFWRLAFPFPYRNAVERHAKTNGLDPFFVAALIRQESEFNPVARSPVGAVGLTQVMPSTGRELSRRVGMRGFRPSMLTSPEVNLRLGTNYLRSLQDHFNGRLEETLASYNAGASRSDAWQTWGTYREPAEFTETIPFRQTRDYVQIIFRNADIYRWLYAGKPYQADPEPVISEAAPPVPPGKSTGAKPAAAAAKSANGKAAKSAAAAKAPAAKSKSAGAAAKPKSSGKTTAAKKAPASKKSAAKATKKPAHSASKKVKTKPVPAASVKKK